MVWKLGALKNASADLSADARSYCFTAPGAYKIGRKDCAVCIATDKTVSRVHAEFVVLPLPPGETKCEAIVRDLSKFGTFLNKGAGGGRARPVLELQGKEAPVKDGDEITFGTGSSTFRATYEHFFFCVSASQARNVISKANTAFGARCVEKWDEECTHLLVEDGSSVTEMVLMAVSQQKPVVSLKWLENVASSGGPVQEIPKCSSYTPTLKFELDEGDGSDVKVVQPGSRLSTYEGIAFLATSLHKYYCNKNLSSIVTAAGGTLQLISKKKVQNSKQQQILIVPHFVEAEEDFTSFQHLQRIREKSLVLGILSGCKDISAFYVQQSPAESQSTDATVDLQDSDDDSDSVAETPPKNIKERVKQPEVIKRETSPPVSRTKAKGKTVALESSAESPTAQKCVGSSPKAATSESMKDEGNGEPSKLESLERDTAPLARSKTTFTAKSVKEKEDYGEAIDKEYGEVRYVVGLVVQQPQNERPEVSGINFKSFRRVGAVPGNSFHAFVPFASEAYRETSYFDDIEEEIKQEKKRAAEEELADELFELDNTSRKRRPSTKATTSTTTKRRRT
ncbi:hypothetical protein SELMODRAFT_419113 [Selaginella moellendorffii]|uniref:FHA domain-containing protein n=1 Tax=Selaginella moellendorffii TaxID=88036 RepID=D8S7W2_SELML|nr:hypothetical protein SELMODRAFT_419113 [Selaginella moellendorffii]